MSNLQQVETIKTVLDLEILTDSNRNILSDLQSERFSPKPAPPVRKEIQRNYPEPESKFKFSWLVAILLSLFFLPSGFIYYYVIRKLKADDIERIRNSDEYKTKCAELDKGYDKQQEEEDRKYKAAQNIYENETLPKYNKELTEWTAKQNEKISQVSVALKNAQTELDEVYRTTKILPLQYRQIPIIEYIYDVISTSDYDIKQAMDLYDRNEQKRLDEQRLFEQQKANSLTDQQNALLHEQNALAEQQNEIAEKARRDANIAAVVGTVQRHSINKNLKR